MSVSSFKAAVLVSTSSPLKLVDEVAAPELKAGQLLVRIHYAGVCHSQLMEARGKRGEDAYIPHMLGHEGSATVVAVGDKVTKFSEGDRVVLGWIKANGLDAGGSVYKTPIGDVNAGAVTTFSEYAVVSENRCVKLPSNIPLDLAVLFGCALPTGAGMVLNQLKPKAGATVAVVGLGGIGLSALIALRLFDVEKVIAIDMEPEKLALAEALGATDTIDASGDVLAAVKELTGGEGVDYCLEAAGTTATIELGFSLVRRGGGQCLFASHPAAGEHISIDPFELICGKSIAGSWGGGARPDEDVPRLAELFEDKNLPFDKLLSHAYSLDEINDALGALERREIVRALICIDGESP